MPGRKDTIANTYFCCRCTGQAKHDIYISDYRVGFRPCKGWRIGDVILPICMVVTVACACDQLCKFTPGKGMGDDTALTMRSHNLGYKTEANALVNVAGICSMEAAIL